MSEETDREKELQKQIKKQMLEITMLTSIFHKNMSDLAKSIDRNLGPIEEAQKRINLKINIQFLINLIILTYILWRIYGPNN